MENKKIIETDSFVSSYWEINISFSGKLNKDNYILISRNNYYCRMFELKIYDDKIDLFDLFSHKDHLIFNYKINYKEINHIQIKYVSLYKTILIINDQCFDLGYIFAEYETYITYPQNINIIESSIKYNNFTNDIPRVYGDCFTALHSLCMFGKHLLIEGSNYYNYSYTSIKNPDILFNQISKDCELLMPKTVFIFMKSYLNNCHFTEQIDRIENIINKYKNVDFITCTMPHLLDENLEFNNYLYSQSKIKYIDFNKEFDNLNKSEYFKDNAHLNDKGAEIIVNKIKIEAPILCKKYDL